MAKQTAITATVVTSLFFVHNSNVQAETQAEIQAQRSEIQTDIEAKQSEINSLKEELISLTEKLNRLEEAIKDNEKVMKETEGNIARVESEAEELESVIADLQKDIDRRNEILKERISSMQQSGGTNSYLEVIFGATNFMDFIDRFSLVTKITSADQELLDAQEEDKQTLEDKKASLEEKLSELEEMAIEYEQIQQQIVKQKEENEAVKEQLEQKQEANKDILEDLRIEDEVLAKKEKAIEEAKRQQELLQSQTSNSPAPAAAVQNQTSTAPSSGSNQSVSTPAVASGNLQTIINAGNKYIGNSVYVFGGGRNAYDIANGRFDCSGFVSWAYSQGGISLPASTSAMSGVGVKVSTSEMKPGDLVFFNTYKTNGHVGIYLGNNKFIGSQNSSGVAVADMSSGYWASTFSGHVRRVVQ
ncbi:NlpC/P60 family protein [Gracilibacillus xinjiangensis]|uniref:NlpC/P60 family protein n=1 Tax=Gracilibacillus xinjiangensis TaxID=1193282 RepID=A0ABV8X1X3_9BACI